MRGKIGPICIVHAVIGFQVCCAQPQDIDGRISTVIKLIVAGDYLAALKDLSGLRAEIGTGVAVDTVEAKEVKSNPDRVTSTGVVWILTNGLAMFRAKDLRGSIQAIDVAQASLLVLLTRALPAMSFTTAQADVKREIASRGEAWSTTLYQATKTGYRAGKFRDSIEFGRQTIAVLHKYPFPEASGRLRHLTHTIMGLDYLALGEIGLAVEELKASLAEVGAYQFQTGPTMALAEALLSADPVAVQEFLDKCSRLAAWPERELANKWKGQVAQGERPELGAASRLI